MIDFTILLPLCFAGLFIGLSLTSIPAASHLVYPLLIVFFDNPLLASGTLLPILIFGDIITLFIYRKHFQKRLLYSMIPTVLLGLLLGAIGLSWVQHPETFRRFIAVLLLLPLLTTIFRKKLHGASWQDKKGSASICGFLIGFLACIGHMGGPIASIFFLGRLKSKPLIIAAFSSLFLLINILKIPIYSHYSMINIQTMWWSLSTVFFVFLGTILGKLFLKSISQVWFERMMFIFILTSCLVAFLR